MIDVGAGDIEAHLALDRLIERCAGAASPDRVRAARREFDERRGQVFEDEAMWEGVTRLFLEWFVLEAAEEGTTQPPATVALDSSDADWARRWLRSQRSLFRIDGRGPTGVTLSDLLGCAEFDVRVPGGFEGAVPGDVMEARLVGTPDGVYFGRGFLFHPSGIGEVIERCVDAELERAAPAEVIDAMSRLRIKCERYPHLTPRRVYESALSTDS